ncbi:MAG: VWA domain-containing protein [Deltaproteobacteria bacterium]|nr:VWA domain-containing protein [Deltaproteobacteria bacterium]
MRDAILSFITELRHAGLRVSLSESMDAMQALAAVGVERELLCEALAASLVKEEEDRSVFDEVFARFFAGPSRQHKGKHLQTGGGGEKQHAKGQGASARPQEPPPEQQRPGERRVSEHSQDSPAQERQDPQKQKKNGIQEELESQQATSIAQDPAPHSLSLSLRHRALLEKPFKEFDARDVEATKELMAELARKLRGRLSRRFTRAKRGRLDFRRTFRASVAHGGIPIELFWRRRRPGKPDLVAFCDLSGSVAMVSDFLLALLAPAEEYLRRVHSFAYVDRLCAVSFENGYVVPHGALDLYARSDFGKVLQQFWSGGEPLLTRNTIVLVLGDARNNRRPPRPDLLARIRERVKTLIWLNPEPHERWNSGDSVMGLYAPVCDAVLSCCTLKELLKALSRAFPA